MDKKKILAITLFLLMGFFMFTFANPSDNGNTNGLSTETTIDKNEDITNSDVDNIVNDYVVAEPVVNQTAVFTEDLTTYKNVTINNLKKYAFSLDIKNTVVLDKILNDGIDNINNAKTKEEIDNEFLSAKNLLDVLKKQELLDEAKENAIKELYDYSNSLEIKNLEKDEVLENATNDITKSEEISEIEKIVEDTKKILDELKSHEIAPIISLNGDEIITLEVHTKYEDEGVTVIDNTEDEIIVNKIITFNGEKVDDINTSILGTYVISYSCEDIDKNKCYNEENDNVIRTINIVDTTPALMYLNGEEYVTVEMGEKYTELKATMEDNYDGTITFNPISISYYGINSDIANAILVDSVDTSKLGFYKLIYNYKDSSSNKALDKNGNDYLLRTVVVVDTTAPELSLNGDKEIIVDVNSTYVDLGVKATDNSENVNVSSTITYNGNIVKSVDTSKLGTYFISYTGTDLSGNTSKEVIRKIVVVDRIAPVINVNKALIKIKRWDAVPNISASATDNYDGKVNVEMTISFTEPYSSKSDLVSFIDNNRIGTYVITYTAKDSSNNKATATKTIIVDKIINGKIDLVITPYINGEYFNDVFKEMVEVKSDMPIFSADVKDYIDNKPFTSTSLTSSLVIDSSKVNMNKVGSYEISFIATDWALNTKKVTRTIYVVDTTKPVITLSKTEKITISDKGLTVVVPKALATDNYDGDISNKIKISINKKLFKNEAKSVTYEVTDANKNKTIIDYKL